MDKTLSTVSPLVSICIPTFNRAQFIEHLFESLLPLKRSSGNDVEICISNNNSSDNTSAVIDEWKLKLDIKVVTQAANAGSTRNCIEVTKLATGRWIHMVGDDDTLMPDHYLELLELLKTTKVGTWILVGVVDADNNEKYLRGLVNGVYGPGSFKRVLLKTGLSRYSFIGQHIIPAIHLPSFHKLPLNALMAWPHLGLLLEHMVGPGEMFVWPESVVKQAGGGSGLYWRADDWAGMQICRIGMIKYASKSAGWRSWFFDVLILREAFGLHGLKVPIAWKLRETVTYNKRAFIEYARMCQGLGLLSVLIVPYLTLVLLLRVTPLKILDYTPLKGYISRAQKRYRAEKAMPAEFDGMKRGI
jgi:glycosyltransferase involved in cell wall biosynthesis